MLNARAGEMADEELPFNGYRVSVSQDEKRYGDGQIVATAV
jgi:hypothetical protein